MNYETPTNSLDEEVAAQIASDIIVAAVAEQATEATAAEQVEKAQIIAHRTRPNLRSVLDRIDENATEFGLTDEEVRTAKRDAIMLSRPR